MMYDKISNADLVRTLVEIIKNACLVGTIHPQHWKLMAEAVSRIEKLEDEVKKKETAERKLELAYTAIRVAVAEFEQVNWGWDGGCGGWDGDCGSRNIIARLEMSLPTPTQPQ